MLTFNDIRFPLTTSAIWNPEGHFPLRTTVKLPLCRASDPIGHLNKERFCNAVFLLGDLLPNRNPAKFFLGPP